MHNDQAAVIEALRSPDAYSHETEAIRVIETHISWVFLTGRFAYKVKKAVQLPYVDFSTLERRELACRDELSLNYRLAPALYHEVVGIGGDPAHPAMGGAPVVEYAVKMTQFPDGATADQLIREDRLSAAELTTLAASVATFHQALPPATGADPAARVLANLADLRSAIGDEARSALAAIDRWIRSTLARLAHEFDVREASGFVRECHGDLHLGNVVRIGDRLIPFDCLEFSRTLRTIDVIDEIAFLVMDLSAHGRRDLASLFLDCYLTSTGDYAGLRLLRLYVAHRALVRAKVALAQPKTERPTRANERAARYMETAVRETQPTSPLCVITSGLSGSGKTTIARSLVPALSAVQIRSDVERKRLHGLPPGARTGAGVAHGIYRPDATDVTYEHLAAAAAAALAGGVDVVIDAAFLSGRERERFRAVAARCDARFLILNCVAAADILRARIIERNRQARDASEADLAVLEHQLRTAESLSAEEAAWALTLNADDPLDADHLAGEIRRRARQVSLSSTSY